MTFSSSSYRVNEGDAVTPELVLSHSRSEAVTVYIEVIGFEARGGEDFAAGPWDVTVPAGRTRQSFSIAAFSDDKAEGSEQFLLHIAPYGHSPGVTRSSDGTPDAVVTITDKARISVPNARLRVQEGGTATIGVVIGNPKPAAFTLDYTLSGTTASGTDVVGGFGARSITVPANARRVDIPIGTVKDTVSNEGVEWFRVRLSTSASGIVFDTTDIEVGIDDADPEVSFVAAWSVTNEQSRTHNVAVKLTSEPASAITLSYTVDGTATAGSDYTALSGTVTVPAGATTATIPVAILDDSTPEGEETVVLALTGGNGYQVASPDTHTLTIFVSDAPRVPKASFTSYTSWVNEDAGTHHLQLKLSSSLPFDITVNYSVTDENATSGSDYEPLPGRVTVPAGATTATIPVTTIDDGDQEGAESFLLRLTNGSGYRPSSTPGFHYNNIEVYIHDDEQLPLVTFSSSSTTLNEGAGTHNVTLNLSPAPNKNITVRYRLEGSRFPWIPSAASGSDFEALSGSVAVLAGATTATIPVTIIDDGRPEGYDDALNERYESFRLVLYGGAGYRRTLHHEGSLNQNRIYIVDNDPLIEVSFASVSQGVVEGAGTRDVTVNLSPTPTADITLDYRVGGTATAGSDYTALSGSVTVSAGAATATIPVAIVDDSTPEGEETVVLTLTDGGGHRIVIEDPSVRPVIAGKGYLAKSPSTHTLTIAASDGPPTMTAASFATASQRASDESGTRNVIVNLNPTPASDITLSYTVGGTATPGSDYTALSGTVAVSGGAATAIIPVTLLADNIPEDLETVVLTLAPGTGYELASPDTHTLTIGIVPMVTFPLSVRITSESVGTYQVPVHLSPAPPSGITVSYTVYGTATSGEDYQPLSGTLSVPARSSKVSIPIAIIDDSVEDSGEWVTLRLTDGPGYTVGSENASLYLVITNHEANDLEGRVQARLDAAVAGGDSVSANLWHRALAAVRGEAPPNGLARLTQADAQAQATDHAGRGETELASLWALIAEVIGSGVTDPPPPPGPEVTIAADATSVTEGTGASFTLTADPAPAAPLAVTVTVAASGDYGVTAGERTVTIPVTGTYTLTLATDNDGADETDGSVSVTVDAGDGYTVGSDASGTVAIEDDDPPVPEVTIAADATSVTEGTGASFTLTATPAPAAPLAVTVTVAASGDYGITAGETTHTIPTTGTYTLTLATDNDGTDEAHGSVTATVDAGDGYTVGATSSGTVAIEDNDPAAPVLPAAHPVVKYASLVKTFYDRITARHVHGDSASGGWNKRFLKALQHPEYINYPQAAVTVADATRLWNHGGPGANTAWNGTVEAVTYAEQYFSGTTTPPPPPDPEVTIAADATSVTEGTGASFTLTATPAPAAALSVTVTVATDGDYGITAGETTYTIPTTGTYTLTLATDNDGVDEADGSVSVTVDAGDGYAVGAASSGTVAIADDDLPPPTPDPVVTVAAGAGVTEGTAATFDLTANPPPAAALEVSVTVAASGDYGIAAGQRTVTLPTTGAYTLTLATDNDGADEPNGSVSATLNAGTGYTVGAASSGTVAIADDDLPPPVVSVTAGTAVTEGGDAVFTVTADRAPGANLAVTLTVTEAAGSDFVAAADEGARTVTIEAGKTAATLTVRTDDDTVDEPDGSVSATVGAGTGYTVAASPKDAASVAVADDDGATSVPVLSVESKSVQEGNTSVIVWATIDPFPSKAAFPALYGTTRLTLATIEGTAWEGVDYVGIPAYFGVTEACNFHTTLAPSGKHGCRIDEVTVLDDSHDDGGETFQLEVGFADSEPARLRGLGAARGTITIENADPLPAAYLARFGRTVAEQALDGIAGRMTAPRTPGMQGTLAGQALSFDLTASGSSATGVTLGTPGASDTPSSNHDTALAMVGIARGLGAGGVLPAQGSGQVPGAGSGAGPGSAADPFGDHFGAGFGDSRSATPSLHSRSISARDALLGSHFSLTGETDASGGTMAFWGRAAQARFDGAERGDGTDITLDGTVTTGMLGADYARGDWLVGLALTQSASEGGYAAIGGDDADPCPGTDAVLCDGALRAGDGEVEASLTAAIPYASVQASERLKLWGAAGYGTGEVTLKTMDERYEADTTWTMAAAGMRGDLLSPPR